ncbi:hypothetical protein V1522DRAFT_416355 [Lipomyces starkeyi]
MPFALKGHRKHTILFNVASLTTAIDYKNTQMKWTNRMFSEANILSTKKTQAGRKAGAQMAEIPGVGESEIRRAGRWNRDEMTSCYLTSLLFKCIKVMSALSPKGDFYIAPQITPPLELQKKLFPAVDYWLSRYYGQTEIDVAIEHPAAESQNLETSIAAGWLVTIYFRILTMPENGFEPFLIYTSPAYNSC